MRLVYDQPKLAIFLSFSQNLGVFNRTAKPKILKYNQIFIPTDFPVLSLQLYY